jgi:peptidoglycan/xylan/chitin deacetylase (PgdA/CDA1 family)
MLMHMNHPERESAEGVIEAIPELKNRGFRFVKLSEYRLR